MNKDELVALLNQYMDDAKDSGNNQSNLDHLDLDVGAKLVLTDESTIDCVLMRDGLTMIYNTSAEGIVANSGKEAKLNEYITLDSSSTYYEYQHSDNGLPSGTNSQFYKVTGTVAYGLAVQSPDYISDEAAKSKYGETAVVVKVGSYYNVYYYTAPLSA
jgi:hypothetical protein